MNNKKKILLLIIIIVLVTGLGYLGYYSYQLDKTKKISRHSPCLSDNEYADYLIDEKYPKEIKEPKIPLTIIVKDKNTGEEKFHFRIDSIEPRGPRPQLYKCGAYVIRQFNYDPKKTKQDPGYKEEIWKYTYDGKGVPIILLAEKPKEFVLYYSSVFRIDPKEIYLALKRGYSNTPDYALVVKSLKTKEDVFVWPIRDIFDKYPSLSGDVGFFGVTKDGRYFWGESFMGAYTLGFLRVDTKNWRTEIFELSDFEFHKGVGGGDALNIEKGYITLHPDYIWIGIQEHYEQVKKEWQEQGKKSSLYLYNLFTKEQIFLVEVDEPLWFFQPKWLSDTELEYTLPDGEKKTYGVNE